MNRILMAAVVAMFLALALPVLADDVTVKTITPDKPPAVPPAQPTANQGEVLKH